MALTRTFKLQDSVQQIKATVLEQGISDSWLVCYGFIPSLLQYCTFRVYDMNALPNRTDCASIQIHSLTTNSEPISQLAHYWDLLGEGGGQGIAESDIDYLTRIKKEIVVL